MLDTSSPNAHFQSTGPSNLGAPRSPQVSSSFNPKSGALKTLGKMGIRMWLGLAMLVLLTVGGAAAAYLATTRQDLRQQAASLYVGEGSDCTGFAKEGEHYCSNTTLGSCLICRAGKGKHVADSACTGLPCGPDSIHNDPSQHKCGENDQGQGGITNVGGVACADSEQTAGNCKKCEWDAVRRVPVYKDADPSECFKANLVCGVKPSPSAVPTATKVPTPTPKPISCTNGTCPSGYGCVGNICVKSAGPSNAPTATKAPTATPTPGGVGGLDYCVPGVINCKSPLVCVNARCQMPDAPTATKAPTITPIRALTPGGKCPCPFSLSCDSATQKCINQEQAKATIAAGKPPTLTPKPSATKAPGTACGLFLPKCPDDQVCGSNFVCVKKVATPTPPRGATPGGKCPCPYPLGCDQASQRCITQDQARATIAASKAPTVTPKPSVKPSAVPTLKPGESAGSCYLLFNTCKNGYHCSSAFGSCVITTPAPQPTARPSAAATPIKSPTPQKQPTPGGICGRAGGMCPAPLTCVNGACAMPAATNTPKPTVTPKPTSTAVSVNLKETCFWTTSSCEGNVARVCKSSGTTTTKCQANETCINPAIGSAYCKPNTPPAPTAVRGAAPTPGGLCGWSGGSCPTGLNCNYQSQSCEAPFGSKPTNTPKPTATPKPGTPTKPLPTLTPLRAPTAGGSCPCALPLACQPSTMTCVLLSNIPTAVKSPSPTPVSDPSGGSCVFGFGCNPGYSCNGIFGQCVKTVTPTPGTTVGSSCPCAPGLVCENQSKRCVTAAAPTATKAPTPTPRLLVNPSISVISPLVSPGAPITIDPNINPVITTDTNPQLNFCWADNICFQTQNCAQGICLVFPGLERLINTPMPSRAPVLNIPPVLNVTIKALN